MLLMKWLQNMFRSLKTIHNSKLQPRQKLARLKRKHQSLKHQRIRIMPLVQQVMKHYLRKTIKARQKVRYLMMILLLQARKLVLVMVRQKLEIKLHLLLVYIMGHLMVLEEQVTIILANKSRLLTSIKAHLIHILLFLRMVRHNLDGLSLTN